MHFVIMGCGRVGARLASTLDAAGHSVAIIDHDSKAFSRLSPNFSGRRVTGVGMDRNCLRQANIKDAYAFAAVSSGDNSNIIAARVAREVFHVEHVVARIYDTVSELVRPKFRARRGTHGLSDYLHVAPGIDSNGISRLCRPGARSTLLRDQRDGYGTAA